MTTKIDGVFCSPNIPETVAGRLMKLAHRPRIASTIIKLISKPILLPILLILVKTIQRIVADPKRKLSPPFDSADSVPRLGHSGPGSGKMLWLFTVLCDYSVWVTETGAPGSGKTIQPIRILLYDSSCCPNHVLLGQVPKPFTQCLLMRYTRVCCTHASCTVSTSSAKVLCNRPSYLIYLT